MEKIRSRAPESKGKEDTRRMLDNYYRSLSYAVWHTPSSQLLPCFLLTIIMTLTDENDVRNFFLCQKYLPHSFYLSGSMSTVIYLFLFFNIRWLFSFSEIVFFSSDIFYVSYRSQKLCTFHVCKKLVRITGITWLEKKDAGKVSQVHWRMKDNTKWKWHGQAKNRAALNWAFSLSPFFSIG